ncbi:hypothetical protein PIB30_035470 [Stylosanthes scabra]|uniref:Uncharacterized protein n=1 Tax=Stylosanthes scabra TaxID=79078 RepID=A0ABU6VED1_9FABA|nr:hypothetical protein [Stylosanthes scabra]
MDRMDDQLSFLCYSNQMANEQMLFPYQNTSRQFKEMEMQGIPVTMANLALHRQKEEEMNQERMRYDQILQEAATQQAREANKGKDREVVPDSEEEEEDSEELASSASEECIAWSFIPRGNDTHFTVVLHVRFGALAEIGAYHNLKVLHVLDGSSPGLPQNFGRRFISPDLSSKLAFSSGNWLGWLSKAVLVPPNCLRVSRSAMVEYVQYSQTIKNKQIFRFPDNGAKNVTLSLGAGTFVRRSSGSPLSFADGVRNVLKEVSQGATKIPSRTLVVLLRKRKGKSVFDWGWL